jgi:hypothetical protein
MNAQPDTQVSSIKTYAISPSETVAAGRQLELGTLAVILVIALMMRLLGITWGLPYVFYPDEAVIVNHAVAFGTGDLNPHYFIYPSLYMYVVSFIYGTSYMFGWLSGVFSSTDDFVRLFFNDATLFYLPGRLIAALSGVGTVALVYVYGRRVYDHRVGLIAAAFLTFNVMHVEFSHYIKTHVPAGLFVMAALLNAWLVYDAKNGNRWRYYLFGGMFSGLGASTIYHAGFVLISVVTAHVLHWLDFSRRSISDEPLLSAKLFGAIVICFFGFLFGTPFAILDWQTFIGEVSSTATVVYHGGAWERGTFFPFTSLARNLSAPVAFLALLSLGYALFRRRPADLILFSMPLFLGGFLMLFRVKEPHHMLIAFAPISILSASLLVDLISWLVRSPILQPVVLTLTTIFLLIVPAKTSFEASYRLTMPDNRVLAKDWVEKNIPLRSKILMDSGKYYLGIHGPPLRLSRWTLEQFIARGELLAGKNLAGRDGSRRIGYPGEAMYFREQLRTLGNQPGYNVIQILHDSLASRPGVLDLEEYIPMGVEYVITSSYARAYYSLDSETARLHPQMAAKYRKFYQALDERATLVKEFSPSAAIAGPNLRIYKLQ